MTQTNTTISWLAVVSLVGGTAVAQAPDERRSFEPDAPEVQKEYPHEAQQEPRPQAKPQRQTEKPGADRNPKAGDRERPQAASKAGDRERPQAAERKQQSRSGQASSMPPRNGSISVSKLSDDQLKALQRTLRDQGHYKGEIDGLFGPKTKSALRQFYREQVQLAARGRILPEGAERLGVDAAEIERVRGEEEGAEREPLRGSTARDQEQQTERQHQPMMRDE